MACGRPIKENPHRPKNIPLERIRQPCINGCGKMLLQPQKHKCPLVAHDPRSLIPICSTHGKTIQLGNNGCGTMLQPNSCACLLAPAVAVQGHPTSIDLECDKNKKVKQPCVNGRGAMLLEPKRHKCPLTQTVLSNPTSSDLAFDKNEKVKQPCVNGCGAMLLQPKRHKCPLVPSQIKGIPAPVQMNDCYIPSTFVTPPATPVTKLRSSRHPVIQREPLEQEAKTVMRQVGMKESRIPVEDIIGFFDDEVKLNKMEVIQVWKSCGRLREKLVDALNDGTSWTWGFLNSGSSFDGTKVTRPDEVDCMFFPKNIKTFWIRIVSEGAPPGYCFLKLEKMPDDKKKRYSALRDLCSDGHFISSEKFRLKVFGLMKEQIAKERRARVSSKQKAGSPSLAVEYDAIPDAEGRGLRTIDMDLVPSIHLEYWPNDFSHNFRHVPPDIAYGIKMAGFDVIPKEFTAEGFDKQKPLLWRLSFSRAEKRLTKFADRKSPCDSARKVDTLREATCRKWVLRMLKRILELIKGYDNSKTKKGCKSLKLLKEAVHVLQKQPGRNITIEKFTTFQLRTLLWTEFYVTSPGMHLWQMSSCRDRLLRTMKTAQKMLTGKMQVPHFFIPKLDIMAEVSIEEREFLYIMFSIAHELF